MLQVIDRKPDIDNLSTTGRRIDAASLHGRISFEGVKFAYPSRPGQTVLHDFSLRIERGQVREVRLVRTIRISR